MNPFLQYMGTVFLVFLGADVVIMIFYLGMNFIRESRKKVRRYFREKLLEWSKTGHPDIFAVSGKMKRQWNIFFEEYIDLRQNMNFSPECDNCVTGLIKSVKKDRTLIRALLSGNRYRRCRAALWLGYLNDTRFIKTLIYALIKEKKEPVKLYMAQALSLQNHDAAIPVLIDLLKEGSPQFQSRMISQIIEFGEKLLDYYPLLKGRREEEIQRLIIRTAEVYPHSDFEPFLLEILGEKNNSLRYESFKCLTAAYIHKLDIIKYCRDADIRIRSAAIQELSKSPTEETFNILLQLLSDRSIRENVIVAISNIVTDTPYLFLRLNQLLLKEKRSEIRAAFIKVVSSRIEYYLPRFNNDQSDVAPLVLKEVLRTGQFSSLISFLNKNRDTDLEDSILRVIQNVLIKDTINPADLQIYLDRRILSKLGLPPREPLKKRLNEKNERINPVPLYFIVAGVFLILPLIFLGYIIPGRDWMQWKIELENSVNLFLLCFGTYNLVLNSWQYLLFIFSFIYSRRQERFRRLKKRPFLFRQGMLPSISVIAPAYCEEATIVESVRALLNLEYPDYEIIVVNDGSSDGTLETLISAFQLVRRDRVYTEYLKAQPVRGLYSNPNIPGLVVVDKVNGGKADSLNAGLNIGTKEYFAAIDSDSILERDALLTVTSTFLDADDEVIASGGNIIPVNGSTVRLGHIEKKRVPKNPAALFQTLEYFRAFMNGRIGWSFLKSLLIISGAFGVFHRERVIEVRGYLTSREIYLKDTVGEDMELVVRLTRKARETGRKEDVIYVSSANCWTEVPESLEILKRQRDRWQRGLIDIVFFHRKMMFNPRYGRAGLTAFPYYLLFEIIGPWFETAAVGIFIAGLALSWIRPFVLLYVILTTIVFGILISMGALIIAEWNGSPFPFRDRLKLIGSAILENFGFRQLMSFFRLTGYVGAMRNVTGWGKMTRAGFRPK